MNIFPIALIYASYEEFLPEKDDSTNSGNFLTNFFTKVKNSFMICKKNPCFWPYLLFHWLLAGFILLPVFTQVVNVLTEFEITSDQIVKIFTLSTIMDFCTRQVYFKHDTIITIAVPSLNWMQFFPV